MSALAKMTAVEAKMLLRDPATVAFGVLFPTVLLLALGAIPLLREPADDYGGVRFVEFFAPSTLVIGMVVIGAQYIPTLIATYRERGILRRMSTTPVHPGYVLVAQMAVALVSATLSAILVLLSAWLILDVPPPQNLGTFVLAFFIGYAAVLAISMIAAAFAPTANAAAGVGTLIFVTLMLFGGVFLPRFLMPDILVTLGAYVPPGVQGLLAAWSPEAAEQVTDAGNPQWVQLGIMLGITVVAGTIAAKVFRWK